MLNKQELADSITKAINTLGLEVGSELLNKISVDYPESKLGDYSSNAALILAKQANLNPKELAQKIISNIDQSQFEKIEVAGPGFINFYFKKSELIASLKPVAKVNKTGDDKILVEYFQPNIAKPLHIGHLRTAIIGDAIVRMLKHKGANVESDTHMGDWGTQFGLLIFAYKKYKQEMNIAADPVNELNKLYVRINKEGDEDKSIHESAKQEFVKLEQGDAENVKIWKQFVDWSMEKFLKINDLMDILPFDHHWPESFYSDKMPAVLEELKQKGILKTSQGAEIVDLESQKLGVAVIVKSDGGTTYLLRDLATFIFAKEQGFKKHLYVVDNRQAHHYRQIFAILKMLGRMEEGDATHIDYGFMSFEGAILSTRKGNMVSAEEVINTAKEKVAKIIEQKNPELSDKEKVVNAVSKGALKYYDLSHNRHSDIEFNWDDALNFDGNSGPYLQYVYARLSSILRKELPNNKDLVEVEISETERQLLFELTKLEDMVDASLADYLPNIFTNYLYNLATIINKFYHESPVIKEGDESKKQFRLALVKHAQEVYGTGLELLGIQPLPEM